MLKFQLRMKIRELEADDKVILNEGVNTLDIKELQQACRERGMRAMGVSELRLRSQLEQWLDLHLNRKIPLSLLILSRALYLPENLPAEDMIQSTISQLPISIETATSAKIAEISGAQIDNKIKLDLLKAEDAEIQREEKESENLIDKIPVKSEKDFAQEQLSKEILVDKAETLSPTEIKEINNLIETLPLNEESQVKAEIAELKKDVNEYKEDVLEVEQLALASKLTETKSAKLLGKRVQKLILDVDKLVQKLETDKKNVTT
jgi:LETM1 and EF-hand domain-containing protein 1, mitochondrial